MKAELKLEIEDTSLIGKAKLESRLNDSLVPDSKDLDGANYCNDHSIRPSKVNGFAVYTRNKLKKKNKVTGSSEILSKVVVNPRTTATEDNLLEIEVKEETMLATRSSSQRFTRSTVNLENNDDDLRFENADLEGNELESETVEVLETPKMRKKMETSKGIFTKGRPTTVRELLKTGLLEGYPVFYNGGNMEYRLRGTIKGAGILCSCSLCMGVQVIPPCKFEIHARSSYRRASHYICLANGKSLLDVVKECQNSSIKTLEQTIKNLIGPLPVEESAICRNCEGSFLAPSAATTELLCDSCTTAINSEVDAECVKSRDQSVHKLLFGDGGLADGTEVGYYSHNKIMRDGHKMGSGIVCHCCSTLVSPSQFEAHAGWASRRKPYMYIFTSDGLSLHEVASSLLKGLMLRDGCPRDVQKGMNRRKCVGKSMETSEVIACVICRACDFSTIGFGPRTVIVCDQCEKEYHVSCLKKHKIADLKKLPEGKWFCSRSCNQIDSTLQNVLDAGEQNIPDVSLDVMRKKQTEKSPDADIDFEVKWRLLRGKLKTDETGVLLSNAVTIFEDSFDPIVNSETGKNIIPSLVYGRKIRGQDFSGMYCAVLSVKSSVVCAAILRVFGQEIAELPLAATSPVHRGKGYFQILYSCIQKQLATLQVKKIVLPSTSEAMSLWKDKFGFSKLTEEQLLAYRETCWQMISFDGASMLEKAVPKYIP